MIQTDEKPDSIGVHSYYYPYKSCFLDKKFMQPFRKMLNINIKRE